mmetsp:Transcript_52341/g.147380  ORF Transcript_52341/g.147380 Transcript_52341/m.147380 type:complete len:236 (-) Transcript_52341:134-841(-)|eukprot:CAMPEP_0179314270 /NCGR_PEP_ID=MMETSP0797-20121207/54329_1 /TAXON_ID=47934 /ORGANISM="Dinophysis acuminata, Strain DAEP01" /LENGTH=235 /DNA_ID=CAMNT_0021024497 /DNA_START=67 /DNA_END=774 /DNA_ORIENTATION=+
MMPFLTFNDSLGQGPKGKFPGLPEQETPEDIAALKESMLLKDTWVLWEQVSSSDIKGTGYADATHEVVSFKTVQEFWAIWNGVPQPSDLLDSKRMVRGEPPVPIDAIMIFKQGVRPEWEDKTNATGGHFQVQLKPGQGGGQIDEYWNNVVLGMIGGTIEPYDMITGVRLVDKLQQNKAAGILRIELWFAKFDDQPSVNALKKSMERCMIQKLDNTVGPVLKHMEVKAHNTAVGKH